MRTKNVEMTSLQKQDMITDVDCLSSMSPLQLHPTDNFL